MVSILPAARTPWDVIGADVGQALQGVLPGAVRQGYERGQIQNGLQQLQNISPEELRNSNPVQLLSKVLGPFAGTEQGAQYAKSIMPFLLEQARISKEQNANYPGERDRQNIPQMNQREQLPTFLNQPAQQQNPFFPNNIGPQGGPGNAPQAATTGQKQPLLTRDQKIADAKNLQKQLNIPFSEALKIVNEGEADKKLMNQEVENERQERIGSQQDYGKRAVDELLRLNPDATPEQQAIFKKKGEEFSTKGTSEGQIDRAIAAEATKFRNLIRGIEDSMSAPRALNKFQRAFLGNEKSFNQAASDLRVKLKPLLNEGLYDTARNLLNNLGYYPEERETIVNPLNDQSKTLIRLSPKAVMQTKIGDTNPPSYEKSYTNNDKQNLYDNLKDLLKKEPNLSLVLGRKGFEDRNYDWRIYKDTINQLIENGEFVPTDDQRKQMDYLDEPPLNSLQKILHGLNLIGR
jgi:hypothetical protein